MKATSLMEEVKGLIVLLGQIAPLEPSFEMRKSGLNYGYYAVMLCLSSIRALMPPLDHEAPEPCERKVVST
jgi:hypothetical protein